MQQTTLWATIPLNICVMITVCTLDTWFDSSPGVQSAEHNHHQLLRPLSEGGVHRRPGDDQTRGRVWLRLQQRPSSAHVQQHELCVLPQPLPGTPQSIGCSGAETGCSNHTQGTSEEMDGEEILKSITICRMYRILNTYYLV